MVFEDRKDMTDAELRMECLHMATMLAHPGTSSAEVINMAGDFKKYVEGTL